jgi:hypothetical protein
MRRDSMSHQFVEFIPEQLAEGVLYISKRYGTAAHKCCCGCGEEVITPLNPTDWSLRVDGKVVSLYPSIGNWSFACRSHYWIRRSKVVWAGQMSQKAIERGRVIDHTLKQKYFDSENRKKSMQFEHAPEIAKPHSAPSGLFNELWATISRWLRTL